MTLATKLKLKNKLHVQIVQIRLTLERRKSYCKKVIMAFRLRSIQQDGLLRPTTHECEHLATHGNFRSRDKDGDHTIRSVISKNPMQGSVLQKRSYCQSKFYIAVIGIFHVRYSRYSRKFITVWDLGCCSSSSSMFDPVTLTLTPWPSYELDPYSLPDRWRCRSTGWAKVNFL